MEPREPHNIGGKYVEKSIGVAPDYINTWGVLGFLIEASKEGALNQRFLDIFLKKPPLKYGEYMRYKHSVEEAESIITQSDPEIVHQIDSLVDELMDRWEAIRGKPELEELKSFWNRIDYLVRQPKPGLQD